MVNGSGIVSRHSSNDLSQLDRWVWLLRKRIPDTYWHSMRMARLAEVSATHFGLGARDKAALIRGCMMHDLGKTMLPSELIQTRGPLSETEWKLMKLHPVLGAELLENGPAEDPKVISIVRHHHERWDGSGYPEGLRGENIPYLARICTVIEAFDSIVYNSSYRNAMTQIEAKIELINNSGRQFDSSVVRRFLLAFQHCSENT